MQKITAHIVPKPTHDNFELLPISNTTSNNNGTALEVERPTEQSRNYRHPTRLLNFIEESWAANLTISQHRRATDLFKTPNVRLTCQQN